MWIKFKFKQTGLKKETINGLVPVILGDIVQQHKAKIAQVIAKESQGPIDHTKVYEPYIQLINKKADEELEKFLKEEHSTNDYEREVKKYQRLVKEITYSPAKVVRVGMFELHCDELIRTLAKRAEHILNKLLERMLKDHFDINEQ